MADRHSTPFGVQASMPIAGGGRLRFGCKVPGLGLHRLARVLDRCPCGVPSARRVHGRSSAAAGLAARLAMVVFALCGVHASAQAQTTERSAPRDASAATAAPVSHPTVTVRPVREAYRFAESATGLAVAIVARTGPDDEKPRDRFYVAVVSQAATDGATSPDDYEPVADIIGFEPGDFSASSKGWEARKTASLTIVDDDAAEPDERFRMVLQKTIGAPDWVQLREVDGTTACASDGCVMSMTIEDNDRVASAPLSLVTMRGKSEVTLTWATPADRGTSAVDGYEYRHAAGATLPEETEETVWTSVGRALTVTVGGLINGTEYAFEVRASSAAGNGAAAKGTATPATVPGEPRHFSAMPADGRVTLTWQEPTDDGGSEIASYEYRYAEGAAVPAATAWTSIGAALTASADSLTNHSVYAFEVRAINDVGEGGPAAVAAAPAAQATVPTVPRNLVGTPGDGRIVLSWDTPASNGGAEITGYFYRYAEGVTVPAGTRWQFLSPDTELAVGDLTNWTEYAFELRAENRLGVSGIARTAATPAASPSAPRSLTARPDDGKVTLAWRAPASNGGSAISRYEYRHAQGASVSAGIGWTSVGTALTVTVGSLTNGREYAFEVRAENAGGEGDAAAETATPATVPGVLQHFATRPGDRQVTLLWQAPANAETSAIESYQFRYAQGASVPGDTAWRSARKYLAVTIQGLINGFDYTFEARASSGVGAGEAVTVTSMPVASVTRPTAPRDLSATPGNGKIALTWEVPTSDGGTAVRRYEYRYAEGAVVPVAVPWQPAGTGLTATIDNLTVRTVHTFEVRAVSHIGAGASASTTVTPLGVPAAPRDVVVSSEQSGIVLGWSAPADNGGANIRHYEMRGAEGATVPAGTPWISTGTRTSGAFRRLTNGTLYSFEVRAVNAHGAGPAAPVLATPGGPNAPRDVVVTVEDGGIVLKWSAPADNGGPAILRYEIRHAPGATVPAGTAWISTGTRTSGAFRRLTNGALYSFEVRAVNALGPGPAAEIQATPGFLPSTPQNLTAEPREGLVILEWDVPADRGSTAITHYEYRYAAGATVPSDKAWRSNGNHLGAKVHSLTNGTAHAFEVRAVNASGGGDAATVTATPVRQPTITARPEQVAYRFGEGASEAGVVIVAEGEQGGGRPGTVFYVSVSSVPVEDGARSPDDYGALSVTVAFSPEDYTVAGGIWRARKTVALSILDDVLDEDEEILTVVLQISPGLPSWVRLREADGTTACGRDGCVATITIEDNDSASSAPQNLAVTRGDERVTLTWTAPADSGTSAITRYEYRHAEGASLPEETEDTVWTSAGTDLTATVGSLIEGTAYTFEVRAVSDAGAGESAGTAASSLSVPSVPASVVVRTDDGGIVLNWSAPADNGGSDILRYETRGAEGASVPASTAWLSTGSRTSGAFRGLTNGSRYSFEVRAVNVRGAGPAAQIQATPGAPTAPQDVTPTSEDAGIVLNWSAPANGNGSAVRRYEMRSAAGASVPEDTAWISTGSRTSGAFRRLTNGSRYSFEVRAVNARGAGPAAHTRATPGLRPSAPRNLGATPADGEVKLIWATPAEPGSVAIERYEYRHAQGTFVPPATDWTPAGTDLTVTVDSLANDTAYAFEVRAVSAVGAGEIAATTATPAAMATPVGMARPMYLCGAEVGPASGIVRGAHVDVCWETGHEIPGRDDLTLEWRLKAFWGADNPEPWSEWTAFARGDTFEPCTPGSTSCVTFRLGGSYRGHPFTLQARIREGDGGLTPLRSATLEMAMPNADATPLVAALWGPLDEASSWGIDTVTGPFALELVFSEPSGNGFLGAMALEAVRDLHVQDFETTNGTVDAVEPWGGGTYKVRVTPTVLGEPVTIELPAGAVRGVGEGITADGINNFTRGNEASNRVSTESARLPALSVLGATVAEAEGALLRFVVRMDRESSDTVTVRYATSDRTATEGLDYRRANGKLTFRPRELEKTVPVTVLDDQVDDDGEMLAFTLSNAVGAQLANPVAIGTITNSDPIPKAWIARFGRSVADQVLDAVDERLGAPRQVGSELSLGGQRIGNASPQGVAGHAERTRLKAMAERLSDEAHGLEAARAGSRTMTGREALTGSSFSLTAESDGDGSAALWGRMAHSRFAGREDTLDLDGDVTTGLLGADYARDRWTMGLVVSHSIGEGGYRGERSGDLEATVTALTPWAGYAGNGRLSLWGVAGYGAGDLTVKPARGTALRTDLDMMLAAAGARGRLAGGNGGAELDAVSDVRWIRTTSARVSSSTGNLAPARAVVTRARLGLEGSWPLALGASALGKGATLTPGFGLGVRHDGGDAETGYGMDASGSLSLAAPGRGLAVSVEGRGVLTHEKEGLRDRGIAGTLSWNPRSSGRGPSLELSQSFGAASAGGGGDLLARETVEGLAANDDGDGRRMEATFGYGFALFDDRFTGTPEIGLGLSDAGRDYRLGWRLRRNGAGPRSLQLSLEALRREGVGDSSDPVHAFGLRLTARW